METPSKSRNHTKPTQKPDGPFSLFRHRGRLLVVFGLGMFISLMFSIYTVSRMPAVAFYLLPPRAWELLCGAFVAALPHCRLHRPNLQNLLSWTGLAALVGPYFLYSKATPFPGLAAIPPCVGTMLFIWSSSKSLETDDTGQSVGGANNRLWCFSAAALLSVRPIVFVGMISYSLYLWHWPLFAFSTYWALEPASLQHRITIMSVGFVLAILSWRFVETPFRKKTFGTSRSTMFLYAGVGASVCLAFAGGIILRDGEPERISAMALIFDAAKSEALYSRRITEPVSLEQAETGEFPRLGKPSPAPIRLLVWGDSHARSILPAAIKAAEESKCGILTAWHSFTPPVLGYCPAALFQDFSLGENTIPFNNAVLNYVDERKIPAVLLASRWSSHFQSDATGKFSQKLLETVKELRKKECAVWILCEVPNHSANVPKALLKHERFGTDIAKYSCTPSSLQIQNRDLDNMKAELLKAGAQFIDVSPGMLEPNGLQFRMEMSGNPLYYDSHHLTYYGASSVYEYFLQIFQTSVSGEGPSPVLEAQKY